MSAPTHKAVKEMKRVGPDDIAYSTVHSLLGLKENIDEKTGARSFVPSKDPAELRIDSFDIVIVDEVSMLSAELFKILYGHIRERDELRIIFMGDPVQIPPVKELDSLALLHAEKYHIKPLTLNTIVRQAQGNPILNYATALRGIYKNGYTSPADYTGSNESGKLQVMNRHDNLDTVLSTYFNDPEFVLDANFMKVIAWTNATVIYFNNRIRTLMYGERAKEHLLEGEKLVMDSPYVTSGKKTLQTNEEVIVRKVQVKEDSYSYAVWESEHNSTPNLNHYSTTLKVYQTDVEYEDSYFNKHMARITILHPESQRSYQNILNMLLTSAKELPYGHHDKKSSWKRYYDMMKNFAYVKYNYAITAHKSQGSTYQNCMVLEYDINANPRIEEKNRIKYVAATRARKNLYIIV